jgi:outer membrane protein
MREQFFRAARGTMLAAFVFGQTVFAFAEVQQVPAPAVKAPEKPAGPVQQLSMEDAVKLALENNLSVQVERLNPEIQDVAIAQAKGAWAPTLTSTITNRDQTSPISGFFAGATDKSTRKNFQTDLGANGLLPWGMNYSASWATSRSKTNSVYDSPNPALGSNLNFTITQPLLRNFKTDGARTQLIISRKNREISDISLRQTVLSTIRSVKSAYMDLKYAKSALEVARQSLDLARESLRNNRSRVEIGTMAPIDIVGAQAEVALREEAVIVAEANVDRAGDRLRTLVFDPKAPDYWSIQIDPTTPTSFEPRPVDVDAAVRSALDKRTDIQSARKQLEMSEVNIKYYRNQQMPDLNAQVNYLTTGQGGTKLNFGSGFPPPVLGKIEEGYGTVLSRMMSFNFPSLTLSLQFSYPLGTSAADANVARARLQLTQAQISLRNLELQVAASVRDITRSLVTNQKRVDATMATRKLMEQRLIAEQKKFAAGMSTNFLVFQAQRDLADAQNNELSAILDYNRSLVDFETVQEAPTAGGSSVVITGSTTSSGGGTGQTGGS